jgi:hypothetical protein
MALDIATQYPGKSKPADADYPFGSARNITTPGDGLGTPLEKAWLNDAFGFQQALLEEAEITPSGVPDTATNSQYLNALKEVFADRVIYVTNVAGLRGKEPRKNFQIVRTLGHTQAGVGSGSFWYDPADTTAPDDNAFTFVTVGGARWKRILYGFVTPEMCGVTSASPTVPQIALDKGLNLILGIATYNFFDLRFTQSGQKIIGASGENTVVNIGSGVGIRNYVGGDAGTANILKSNSISFIKFVGTYTPTDTDDWYLTSGETKTLISTNVAILMKAANDVSVHDCQFFNMHDGVQFYAGVYSYIERNKFSFVQRGVAYDNGAFYGDLNFKCTSQKCRDNTFADSWFGIWGRDLVDNSLTEGNVQERCNTGEFYFNCNGVSSKNYHEQLFEGILIDGSFTGSVFIEDNSFFGGVPGDFWGNGAAVKLASSINSGARVIVGKITGPAAKPWIEIGATAQFRGKVLVYNGFNGQEPGFQFYPQQAAESDSGAVIETFYFSEADQFEIEGYITEVNGSASTSGGYFKIVLRNNGTQIVEVSNAGTNGSASQKVRIFIGSNFFQLTNGTSIPFSQKVEFRVKRILTGDKF